MKKQQTNGQPPDTGKLTNFHYATEQDHRTKEIEQKAKKQQGE
jgi:hypothetical protein